MQHLLYSLNNLLALGEVLLLLALLLALRQAFNPLPFSRGLYSHLQEWSQEYCREGFGRSNDCGPDHEDLSELPDQQGAAVPLQIPGDQTCPVLLCR